MKDPSESNNPDRFNMLSGTEEAVNRWMQFEKSSRRYRHKSACQELSRRRSCGEVVTLIEDLYNKIDSNWMIRSYARLPSPKNWRLTHELKITEGNKSKEKQLEKIIVELLGDDWSNQVPTASGLTGPDDMKKASIDLVHRIRPACYELIELKCDANTPLYAAIEILFYGLLYIHARDHQKEMQYSSPPRQLLLADEIGLRVLAPEKHYRDYDLGWFEKKLSDGIGKFVGLRFKIDFKFTAFPGDFQWDTARGREKLQAAMNGVTRAFPGR